MADSTSPVPSQRVPEVGDAGPKSAPSLRVCLITIGGELFAVDLRNVREVFEVESLTAVPGMPPILAGVANLRGVVIPVVDLRPLLGVSGGGRLSFAVVLRHGPHQVGVLVEQVPQIRTVQQEDFLPAPLQGAQGPTPFVNAILKMEGRIGGVVEVPTLLSYVEGGTVQPQVS